MGYRIRELRISRKMSQQELADRSGVARQTINMIENDELHNVKSFTLERIAAGLEVELKDLFLPSASSKLDEQADKERSA